MYSQAYMKDLCTMQFLHFPYFSWTILFSPIRIHIPNPDPGSGPAKLNWISRVSDPASERIRIHWATDSGSRSVFGSGSGPRCSIFLIFSEKIEFLTKFKFLN